MMMSYRIPLLASVCLVSLAAQPAFAQDSEGEDAQETTGRGQLDTIVVTAQLREQTLQEVPVSVSVVDNALIQDRHINNITGLGEIVPNLSITRSPFQPFVAIRGLGSGAGTRAFEQSVATYVDGVYAGRANQFLNPFFDVERVEVVRGPQSVLFGVNAIAGAINVVNRKPEGELEGYFTAGYEFENNGYNIEGGVSVPLGDTLGIRLAGRANREGPYLVNTVTGGEEPDIHSQIGRATLSWEPSTSFRANLSYEHGYSEIEGAGTQTTFLPLMDTFPPEIEDGSVDFTKSSPGSPDFTELETDTVALNMELDVGEFKLTSTSAFSHYTFEQAVPAGAVPAFFGTAGDDEAFSQYYQEVRLQSPSSDVFEFLVGAAYYHQDSRFSQGVDFDLTLFGATGVTAAIRNELNQDTDSYSAFAQGTFYITPDLDITFGGRYSVIDKSADYVIAPAAYGSDLQDYDFLVDSMFILQNFGFFLWLDPTDPSTFRSTTFSRQRQYEAFNPSVSINWRPTNEISAYASFTTGTKAGGFNDQEKTGILPENGFPVDTFEYDPEDARNFEIGTKFDFGNARINAALFYSEYEDLQASQAQQNGSILTTNAAQASATGFELDATVLVSDGLTLRGDIAYIDATYDDYPGSGCIISLVPDPTCNPATANAAGGRLNGVPKFTASFTPEYVMPLGSDFDLTLRGRAYYNDGAQYQSNQDPLDRTPSYWLFDASVELASVNDGWSVSVSGQNLANRAVRGFSAPAATPLFGHQSLIQPGRRVFLDLRYVF